MVGDDGATEIKADAHYTAIIAVEGTNEYRAAALAARTLAAHYALKVSTTVGAVKAENQQKSENYRALANDYDKSASVGRGSADPNTLGTPVVTGVSESEMDTQREDTDRYNSAFYRGMHDNEGACSICGCCDCDCGC
jgi:hypothetical protein